MKKLITQIKLKNMLFLISLVTVGIVAGLSLYLWFAAKDLINWFFY
ncbi:MAG: hypothetical protein U0T83_07205 [Bacteriovoracaceae bacterium]